MMKKNSCITSLKKIAQEFTLRFDVNYMRVNISNQTENYYSFFDLFDIIENDKVDYSSQDDFKYAQIGDVSPDEKVNPVSLNFDLREAIYEDYYKKIEKGDIIKVNIGDILISKVRPYLKKIIFINKDISDIYYTNAFIHLRPKCQYPKVMFYALKSVLLQSIIVKCRQGKGYPTLSSKDLRFTRFKKEIIDTLILEGDNLTKKVECIEKEIETERKSLKDVKNIINSIVIEALHADINKIRDIDNEFIITSDLHNIGSAQNDLRCSYRFTKAILIERELKKLFDYDYLGNYLIGDMTKNGWSPDCDEENGDVKVLGLNAIRTNGILDLNAYKYTNQTRSDIDSFLVKEGDILISRGNTVDYVALASIAYNVDEHYIYPDLMIKLTVDESRINKAFLAYYINSIFGRLFFKYSSRGKQQTMVKVSSDIVKSFVVPKISKKQQDIIVQEIQKELNVNLIHEQNIIKKRQEIDKIIINAITN